MVTVIYATFAVGVIAVLLLFGHLSDQIGRRWVLLAGLAQSALSAGAFSVTDGPALLLVGRIRSGLSAGAFTGAATSTLVDLAPPDRCARARSWPRFANVGDLGCWPRLAGLLSEWRGRHCD
jgi:MFS family permease